MRRILPIVLLLAACAAPAALSPLPLELRKPLSVDEVAGCYVFTFFLRDGTVFPDDNPLWVPSLRLDTAHARRVDRSDASGWYRTTPSSHKGRGLGPFIPVWRITPGDTIIIETSFLFTGETLRLRLDNGALAGSWDAWGDVVVEGERHDGAPVTARRVACPAG